MQQDASAVETSKKNDAFRRSSVLMVTRGIFALGDVQGVIKAVRNDDKFTENNDPYGQHDFGVILWDGEKIFWKIDYYDQNLKFWADPTTDACRRVLTVMLAEEY